MKELVLFIFAFFNGHSIFLATQLFLRHRNTGNKLLGILLILMTLRVGKSVLILYKPELALSVSVIGLVSMAGIGPLVYLYVLNLFSKTKFRKIILLHFIPAAICLFFWNWTYLNYGYFLISLLLNGYLFYTTYFLYQNKASLMTDSIRFKWATWVLIGLYFLSICFILQLIIYKPVLYLTVIGFSCVWLYALSLWAIKQNQLFTEPTQKKIGDETKDFNKIGEKINQLLKEEIYLDHDLTLSKLAKLIEEPPYLVSKAVNSFFNQSLPELIVRYRIAKAERLLLSPSHAAYTIEGIAFESGFSTLSAFYQAFKNIHGMPPTKFKKLKEKTLKI